MDALSTFILGSFPTIDGGIGGTNQTVPVTAANFQALAEEMVLAVAKINALVTAINNLITVTAVAAAGNAQGNAAALSEGINIVSAADDTKGVKLPTAAAGKICIVKSTVANKILKVYPNTDDVINALSANAAISLASGPTPAIFVCADETTWYTVPLLPS